ncbi:3-galactosyl-N-acetylglucosaminide 4-alpha-L-fucosyltransferase FUT3-like [Pleurodeles waltl]
MESTSTTPSTRKILFLFLLQFITAVSVFLYVQTSSDSRLFACPSEKDKHVTDEGMTKVTILLWTWPFGERIPLDKCYSFFGISGCFLTEDHRWYNRADAVIFHHRDVSHSREQLLQIPRFPTQQWVWYNMESPSNVGNLEIMSNLINLTMSYRRDSDIFTPYGSLVMLKEPQNFSIPAKSKLVSWVISNWNPGSRRVQYYEELQKHIQVDIFGRISQQLDTDQKHFTISQYKFYLSFENSEYQDYITEKLWDNALLSGTVPVVLGPTRENYELFLPAEAFIHVDDFSSAQELADYLNLLDSDNEKYKRYFDWRRNFKVIGEFDWTVYYCKACQYVRQNPSYKTIPSVAKWFA